jgi:peptidyl-prolyl cis-trans isomerase C
LGSLLLTPVILSAAGEDTTENHPPATAPKEALVTINGRAVSRDIFSAYYQIKRQSQPVDLSGTTQQLALLNELINYMLLEQDAVSKRLDQQPEVAAQLEVTRSRLLASAAINEYLNTHKPSEENLKRAYEQQFKGKPLPEYKVSHILLKSKAEAGEVIEALKGGEAFTALAKERSQDTSAESGGELGWLSTGQMDPALQAALEKMAEGTFSPKPVKSEFGWHVLLLEQIRNIPQPSYAEMRDTLLQEKQKQQLATYIRALREKAKLDVNVLRKAGSAPSPKSK